MDDTIGFAWTLGVEKRSKVDKSSEGWKLIKLTNQDSKTCSHLI